jgi:hypothetical protein
VNGPADRDPAFLFLDRLGRLLADAKVKPSKAKLAPYGDDMQAWALAAAQQMTVSLPDIARLDRARRVEKLQQGDKKAALERLCTIKAGLDKALQGFEAGPLPLFFGYKPRQQIIQEMRSLRNDVEQSCRFFESLQFFVEGRKYISTYLYLDLFWLYSELTGRTGLGDEKGEGPFYRFAKACTALVDPDIEFPDPGTFRQLMTDNKPSRCNP